MNIHKNLLFLSLFSGLVLTGCQASNTNMPSTSPSPSPVTENETTGQTINGTLQNLLAMGGPVMCEWESTKVEDGSLTGEVMIGDPNSYRINMVSTTQENGTLESYIIGDGEWVYYYSPSLDQGFRVRQAELMELGEKITLESNEQWGLLAQINQNFNYDCDEWEVDTAEFDLPEGQEFTDITDAVNKLTTVAQ